jgi:hypothetical protein
MVAKFQTMSNAYDLETLLGLKNTFEWCLKKCKASILDLLSVHKGVRSQPNPALPPNFMLMIQSDLEPALEAFNKRSDDTPMLVRWQDGNFVSPQFIKNYTLGTYDHLINAENVCDMDQMTPPFIQLQLNRRVSEYYDIDTRTGKQRTDEMQRYFYFNNAKKIMQTNTTTLVSKVDILPQSTIPQSKNLPIGGANDLSKLSSQIDNALGTKLSRNQSRSLQDAVQSFAKNVVYPCFTIMESSQHPRSKNVSPAEPFDAEINFWFQWRGYCRLWNWAYAMSHRLNEYLKNTIYGQSKSASAWSDLIASWNVGQLARAGLCTVFPHCFGVQIVSSTSTRASILNQDDIYSPVACILLERIDGSTIRNINAFVEQRGIPFREDIYDTIFRGFAREMGIILTQGPDGVVITAGQSMPDSASLEKMVVPTRPWKISQTERGLLQRKNMANDEPYRIEAAHTVPKDGATKASFPPFVRQTRLQNQRNINSELNRIVQSRFYRKLLNTDEFGLYGLPSYISSLYKSFFPNLRRIETCVAVWAQFVINAAVAQSYIGFSQNDMHEGNLAVTRTSYAYMVWKLRVRRQSGDPKSPIRGRALASFNKNYEDADSQKIKNHPTTFIRSQSSHPTTLNGKSLRGQHVRGGRHHKNDEIREEEEEEFWTEHFVVLPTHGFLSKLFDSGLATCASRWLPAHHIPSNMIETLTPILDRHKSTKSKHNEIEIGQDQWNLPVYASWNYYHSELDAMHDKHDVFLSDSVRVQLYESHLDKIKTQWPPSDPTTTAIPKVATSDAPGEMKLDDLLSKYYNGSFVERDEASGLYRILSLCHHDLERRLLRVYSDEVKSNRRAGDSTIEGEFGLPRSSLVAALDTPEFHLLRLLTADTYNRCSVWHKLPQFPTLGSREFTGKQENLDACAPTWDPAALMEHLIQLYEQPKDRISRDYLKEGGQYYETTLFTSVDIDLSENTIVRYD